MAKKKAKWLEEATTKELIIMLEELLNSDPDEKAITKAAKIASELVERQPEEPTSLSVTEAIEKAKEVFEEAIENIKTSYDSEVADITGGDDDEEEEDDDDEDEEEEEEEEEAPKSSRKKTAAPADKKAKRPKKVEEPEEEDEDDEEEDDEDDEDDVDYSDLSIKALKTECRKRGLKVTKGAKKSELIKQLEADDKE